MLSACGGGSPTPAPPTPTPDPVVGVVQTYFNNLKTDCAAAWAMFDDAAVQGVGSESDYCGSFKYDNRSATYGQATHDDSTHAHVAITVVKDAGDQHSDFVYLAEVDGNWKIDNLLPSTQAPGTAALDFNDVEAQIENQYQHQTGHAVNVRCADSGKQTLQIGDVVSCAYTTDADVTGTIKVTATTFNNWLWKPDGQATTPVPSPYVSCTFDNVCTTVTPNP